jgi:hypothetical protein
MPAGWSRASGVGPQSRVISSGLVYGPTRTGVNDAVCRQILTSTVTIWPQDGAMETIPPEALIAPYPPEHQEIANALRRLVRRAVPESIERVRPGWGLIGYDVPVGRKTRYFAFIWLQTEHVHIGFEHGVLMDDPDGVLQGAGVTKNVRWLTLGRADEVDETEVVVLVREAARVASMSRSERLARLIDLEDDPLGV